MHAVQNEYIPHITRLQKQEELSRIDQKPRFQTQHRQKTKHESK